jgi:predicted dehydrogenase
VISQFAAIAEACRIEVAPPQRRPIATVGAGAIMNVAHLPAYSYGGLDVVGIFDTNADAAREVALAHGIAQVYPSIEDLLGDDAVEVVDIAVPASIQPEIVRMATVAQALDLADLADQRGLVLGVNQQLRFDEGMAAAHAMVDLGWLGKLTFMTINVNIWTEWSQWAWMLEEPHLEIMNHSIHYHDVIRWFLGEPKIAFCAAGRTPGQAAVGETRTITTTLYESGARALVHANHENDTKDDAATFRIDGTHGSIRGTLGLLYDYPHGRPDTLEVCSTVLPTDGWVPYPVTTRWIPDAFLGPMASVLAAASGGPPPRSSARDNAKTLRLIEALYKSIETGQAQALVH